jgi:hypothetical protein
MMDRREFLAHVGNTFVFMGMTITLSSCGSDDAADPAGPGNTTIAGEIANNHGHSVSITQAQIDTGGTILVSTTGGGHLHEVEIPPAQVSQLANRQPVTVTSSNGGSPPHTHGVTFTPA